MGGRKTLLTSIATIGACAIGLWVGLSVPTIAAERATALDKAIPPAMERALLPGVIVGIWEEGHEPYVRTFGVSDSATGAPMTADMYVRIGSTTKSFTVTSVLMLADRGQLSLDDTDKYVEGVPNGDRITLRHLAGMRSGLCNYAEETIPKMHEDPRASGRRANC